jgi:hypothetical protein
VRPGVETELDRLFDLVIVPADRCAMLAEHVELACDVRTRE